MGERNGIWVPALTRSSASSYFIVFCPGMWMVYKWLLLSSQYICMIPNRQFFISFMNFKAHFIPGPGRPCPGRHLNLIDETGSWQDLFQSPPPGLSFTTLYYWLYLLTFQLCLSEKSQFTSLHAFSPLLNSQLFRAQWLFDGWCSYHTFGKSLCSSHTQPALHIQ